MVKKIIITTMGVWLGLNYSAFAVEIGSVDSAGRGCEPGTLESQVYQQNDGSIRLDVFFSDYGVSVGGGSSLDRSSCNLAIPISLSARKKLRIEKVYLKVDGIINEDSRTNLNAEVFTAGDQGPKIQREIIPDQSIQGRFILRGNNVYETQCGEVNNLRVNTSLLLSSQGTGLDSVLSGHSATLIMREVSCSR